MIKQKKLLLITLIVGILIPVFIIAIFNRPVADDYDYTYLTGKAVLENGFNLFEIISAAWKTNLNFYNTWQGLYSSAFILSLSPNIFGEQLYGLGTYIIITTIIICSYVSISNIYQAIVKQKNIVNCIYLTSVFVFFIIQCLPDPTEGLFWYNGAANYIIFAFLNFVVWSYMFKIYINQEKNSMSSLLYLCLLSFFISGGNHVTAFANILFLLTMVIFFYRSNRRSIIIIPLVAIIGFIVMMISPGTAIRSEALGGGSSVIISIVVSLYKAMGSINEWINLSLILYLILVTPIIMNIIEKYKIKYRIQTFILLLIGIVCFIGAMYCVPFYSMGGFGEGRLINVIWITFIALSTILYAYLIGLLINSKSLGKISNQKNTLLFIIQFLSVIYIGVFGSGQASVSFISMMDLMTGEAQNFSKEMDERIIHYINDELSVVKVAPLESTNTILYFGDITNDPNIWPNTSIGEYYNKKIYVDN